MSSWNWNTERKRDKESWVGGGVGGPSADDERSFRQVSRSGVVELGQVHSLRGSATC